MEAVLADFQALFAFAVALFTGGLWWSTHRLGDLQKKMNELQADQLDLQKKLADIQKQLAKGDLQPLINVSAVARPDFGIRLTNLGKYGVQLKRLLYHQKLPESPGSGGQDLSACSDCPSLPIALPPGGDQVLHIPKSNERQDTKYLEVLYTHGANPGILLSDLWKFEYVPSPREHQSRLTQVWGAEEVRGKEST